MYILSELEQYIKKDSYLPFFIRSNIHQDILASIVLYQTSAEDDKNYSMIQIKLRAICYLLYEHICPLLDRKLFKGTSLEG